MNLQTFQLRVAETEQSAGGSISPGICSRCTECQRAHGMDAEALDDAYSSGKVCDEGGFSWRACECCGSSLGGNRYAAHAWNAELREILHFEVCTDCLCYLANGDLPGEG